MLAAIHYYKDCDFYDMEVVESITKAKTKLLLAGYLPADEHPMVWRKTDEDTALIVPYDEH